MAAQAAPLVGSTLRTTSTATTSVRVGCTNAGTCTGGIVAGPIDVSSVVTSGPITIASNVPGVTTFKLYNNAGNLFFNGVALATGASLSGTTNTIPVFTAANAVGNSIMTQSGTTITVATTLNATTLGGTLSTASQPNVTTMAGLVSVGTITTGTWSGTIIGLAKGGTNADLSGTGGTSQFLRQNTVGGTITVVRPAVSDLSDASNVALLNAVNTFTAFGTHTFSAGSAGSNTLAVRNTSAGTGNMSSLFLGNDNDASNFFIQSYSSTYTTGSISVASGALVSAEGAGGLSVGATNVSGALRLLAGGLQRWGINTGGDLTVGSSPSIVYSVGTPTLTSGGGSGGAISGSDSSFQITLGTGPTSPITVTFGHAFTSNPRCTASAGSTSAVGTDTSGSSTAVTIFHSLSVGNLIYVHCLGR